MPEHLDHVRMVETRENHALRTASLDGVRTAHPVCVDNLDSSRAGTRYLGRGKRDAVRPLTKLAVLIQRKALEQLSRFICSTVLATGQSGPPPMGRVLRVGPALRRRAAFTQHAPASAPLPGRVGVGSLGRVGAGRGRVRSERFGGSWCPLVFPGLQQVRNREAVTLLTVSLTLLTYSLSYLLTILLTCRHFCTTTATQQASSKKFAL